VAGLDDGTLRQGLARLVEAQLVFVRGIPPEATYTFKHALVQEFVIRDHDRPQRARILPMSWPWACNRLPPYFGAVKAVL